MSSSMLEPVTRLKNTGNTSKMLQIACLCNIPDLQKTCQKQELKFSRETNDYLLYLTLRKLGPLMAQKVVSKLVERGEIQWNNEEDFEVEFILDHQTSDEEPGQDAKEYYLIKWKGWSNAHNTWEPKENLNCPEMVEEYHEILRAGKKRKRIDSTDSVRNVKKKRLDDLFQKISKSPLAKMSPLQIIKVSSEMPQYSSKFRKNQSVRVPRHGLSKRSKWYKQKKLETLELLKTWQREINATHKDPAPIMIENSVDLEGPPDDFTFIADYKPAPDITIPQDPIVGCSCVDCKTDRKKCCSNMQGADYPYNGYGRVRIAPGNPIYECNDRCRCDSDCPNRIVQKGRKFKVCIFRTSNGSGWGVKALQKIKKGSFVMEYVGEIITNEEAERRGMTYDVEGRTYLFDLDYNEDDCPFTVDAGIYGNVAHFVNHSCDPNLAVYGVWINCLDPRLPRICLFATRDIKIGEELTFDYMMTGATVDMDDQPLKKSPCTTPNKSPQVSTELIDTSQTTPMKQIIPISSDTITPEKPIVNKSPHSNGISHAFGSARKNTPSKAFTPIKEFTIADAPQADNVKDKEPLLANTAPEVEKKPVKTRTDKYRIACQCGSSKCRGYLF